MFTPVSSQTQAFVPAHAAYPHDNPTTPADITATVYHALGFDPETIIRDQLNRPMPISEGRPIFELF